MIISFKQKKRNFKPRIKLNNNILERQQGWLLQMLLKQELARGTKQRIGNEVTDRASVQVLFPFFTFPFLVLIPLFPFL